MTINSGLNGRAVKALMELGACRAEVEALRQIIYEIRLALTNGATKEQLIAAIDDAMDADEKQAS